MLRDTNTNKTPSSPTSGAGSTFQAVAPNQVNEWLNTGEAVLIDVREPDEFAREHINGAKLLPLSGFDPARAIAHATPGQRIVMHCKGGRRSADACRLASALAAGGSPIFTMTGGIDAWKKEHLPVIVNARLSGISVMRQTQIVIGLGVLGGAALAWFVHPAFVAIGAFFGAGLVFAGASGTCALASLIGMLPWNKVGSGSHACLTGDGA